MPTLGLVMMSTAPISRARMAASVLGPVNPDKPRQAPDLGHELFQKSQAIHAGHSRSKRMTSGGNFFILSMAMNGSAAR